MCMTCWQDDGAHQNDTPEVRRAATLIAKVYSFSMVGGNAHVVVDDYNLEDHSIRSVLDSAIPANGHEAGAGQLAAERECMEALLALSFEDRLSALGLHDGWWGDFTDSEPMVDGETFRVSIDSGDDWGRAAPLSADRNWAPAIAGRPDDGDFEKASSGLWIPSGA